MTTSGDNGGLAIELEELMGVLREIEMEIEDQRGRKVDMGRIKEVDRRLRLCSNPEKIVGSALWVCFISFLPDDVHFFTGCISLTVTCRTFPLICRHRKRKAEEEAEEEEKRAKKAEKARTAKAADEAIFGGVIIPGSGEGGGLTSALLAGRDNGLDGSDGEWYALSVSLRHQAGSSNISIWWGKSAGLPLPSFPRPSRPSPPALLRNDAAPSSSCSLRRKRVLSLERRTPNARHQGITCRGAVLDEARE
jgi:hypothetical protein